MCNGHADTCNVLNSEDSTPISACHCLHNTDGTNCDKCRSGFEQKKWKQNTDAHQFYCERELREWILALFNTSQQSLIYFFFAIEACNCYGHSNECEYDAEIDKHGLSIDMHGNYEGGGVCKNCQDNTEGINCSKCKSKFYRPGKSWHETDICKRKYMNSFFYWNNTLIRTKIINFILACDCDKFYSTGNCEQGTGKCECKKEFQEPDCLSCSQAHFAYPSCTCEYITEIYFNANQFMFGFEYFWILFLDCDCDLHGAVSDICDKDSGECSCKKGFSGSRCDKCVSSYYNYPNCVEFEDSQKH